jgi:hypothetical protein
MSIDEATKLVESISKLIAVLVWPAIILFVLVRFGPGIREFFSSVGEFSLKAGGIEASAKRKQAEAVAALAAAAVSSPDKATSPTSKVEEARAAATVVAETVTPNLIRRASNAKVLWVDDRPDNNVYERQALSALGVSFVLATSTEEALEKNRTSVVRRDYF